MDQTVTRDAARSWARALLATYAFRFAAGLLLALPFVNAVRASRITHFPEGDRLLFQPGGDLLLEVIASQRELLVASLGSTLWMLALLSVLALGPEFLLLRAASSTSGEAAGGQDPTHGARRALQRMLTLGAAVLLARALLAGLALALAFTARSWFTSADDPRIADAVFASVVLLGVLIQLAVSTLRDLTAAAIVARGWALPDCVAAAVSKLRLPAFGAYAAAFAATLLLMLLGALAAAALDVGRAQGFRTALVFAVHQAVVLGSVAARGAWLSNAVRRVLSDRAEAPITPMRSYTL
jgi:hypothetical protein